MSHLSNWDIDESLFQDLIKHVQDHLYPFKHHANQDIELCVVGYVSNEPGIIFEIINVYEFTEKEISAWKHILMAYGADKVDIGIDTLNKTLTLNVYINPKKETKKSSDWKIYKLFAWLLYIPTFVWVYCLLLLWNPIRYNLI